MSKYNFSERFIKNREQCLKYYREKTNCKKRNVERFAIHINSLYQFMLENNIKEISELKEEDLTRYQVYLQRAKSLKPKTVKTHLDWLNKYCRYLLCNNLIWKNPFSNIRHISLLEAQGMNKTRYYNTTELMARWIKRLKNGGAHIENIRGKLRSFKIFTEYLQKNDIKTVYGIEPDTVHAFGRYLSQYEYKPGLKHNAYMQTTHMRNICGFLLYLYGEGIIKDNPAAHIQLKDYYEEIKRESKGQILTKNLKTNEQIPDKTIQEWLDKFIQYALSRGISEGTIRNYKRATGMLYKYMQEAGIKQIEHLIEKNIMDYQSWLVGRKTRKGGRYAMNTIQCTLISLRSFFRYITKCGYIQINPAANIELPKREQGIPHSCMTEREIKILLDQPNIMHRIGLRDKAILETLYSTGIRANELINLRTGDIDFVKGLCRVDYPKGGKSYQRIIPIGNTACDYVKKYMTKVRPLLDGGKGKDYLFISSSGMPLKNSMINIMIQKNLMHAGIKKRITTHSFRVTCATHMLTHKADIRYVQEQLGHKSIKTTQGYTRLVPRDLKLIHARCHPREHLREKTMEEEQ